METDACVGRVLAALEKHGLDENTLVIATSDHGPAPYAGRKRDATNGQLKELEREGHYAGGIYRGYKFSIYEGGFRVPFVVRWPRVVAAKTTCDRLVGLHDLTATVAEIVGCELAANEGPDSISILPLFEDATATAPRQSIILQATRGMAICSGDWKLVFCPGSGCEERWLIPIGHEPAWKAALKAYGKKLQSREELYCPPFVQLFNLTADPSETTDLAEEHPEKIHELRKLFDLRVKSGRSTPGDPLANDRENIKAFPAVPASVWQRPASKTSKR
jgi:arylsulfatase A